ncbi:MAG: N-acetylneuraminate synthase family protein, partial [Proteobacteria bacterium]|nr:N-acetylneuraminate synthase family protein [Pseudomonadota bacterium]
MSRPPSFQSEFAIADRPVGGDAPCLIIAEAGVAHFGDIALARDLVDLAADAGADIFKTQFFDVEALFAERASEWRDRLRPRNLTLDEAQEIKQRCHKRGLLFMSTAHDESRIPWLEALDVPAVKVGSGERNNPAFLTRLAELGKPMIVSTGMYGEQDVSEALAACAAGGCDSVALLHCVTSYPTPPDEVNLSAMDALGAMFSGPVGYSDHTVDGMAVLAAVSRGAKIIEKHITILRDVPNAQDWKVSADPETLAPLIADIRRIERMIGHGRKEPTSCEAPGMAWALKSLVAVRALPSGHVVGADDMIAMRP